MDFLGWPYGSSWTYLWSWVLVCCCPCGLDCTRKCSPVARLSHSTQQCLGSSLPPKFETQCAGGTSFGLGKKYCWIFYIQHVKFSTRLFYGNLSIKYTHWKILHAGCKIFADTCCEANGEGLSCPLHQNVAAQCTPGPLYILRVGSNFVKVSCKTDTIQPWNRREILWEICFLVWGSHGKSCRVWQIYWPT